MHEFKAQQGFLTIAQNSDIDYLRLAYVQAMSIKGVMPNSKYAVIVDDATAELVIDQYCKVFDYVISLPQDYAKNDQWKLANEWQIFNLTPFKETIKLEADLLITRNIEHWWTAFRLKDIVLSLGCKDYQGNMSNNRAYRQFFNDNDMPDTYNGLMYFRYSQHAHNFFNLAREIWTRWDQITPHLKNYRDELPTTDVVYALTAKVMGVESCTLPECDFINFTHMKNAINGWSESTPWPELIISETDLPIIRINNINQYCPLHYHEKTWVTDDMVKEYEAWLKI